MIKKALLVICLMIAPSLAIANVFSDALSFVCGGGTVEEDWNGNTSYPSKNEYCPPYNKFGNRGGCLKKYSAPQLGTIIYMQYCAEEAPSSSYFNPKIQVRMQSCNPLACWALSSELNWDGECVLWPTPLLFPLQRLCARMAAPADDTATPATPADDGYTYFKHLNFEGAVVDDPRIPGTDGQSTFIVSPKTCAYWDPWAFDLFPVMPINFIPFFDIFDYNPIKQPFHKNAGVHPLVQMMISFLEIGLNSSQMILKLMVTLPEASTGPIGLLVEFIGDKSGLTKMIIDMVSSCIKIVGEEVFVRILKEFGQLNHVVYRSDIGCVPVPMGPFPPPYPKQYASAPPAPTIEPVCASTAGYVVNVTGTASNFVPPATTIAPDLPIPPSGATLLTNNGVTDANGNTTYGFTVTNQDGSTTTTTSVTPGFIASSNGKKCATSTKSNNIINNVVRVGIDRILPRCDLASLSNSNNATVNTSTITVAANSCVNISGSLSAKVIALNPAGIPSCKNSPNSTCVAVTTPAVCAPAVCGGIDNSTSSSTCPAALAPSTECPATSCGYRAIYATQYVAGATPLSNPYYDPTLPDCNGLVYPCQVVWGVNAGPYTDLVVPFPTTESSSTENTQTLVNMNPAVSSPPPATLCHNGQSYSFRAAVSRVSDTPVTLSYATTANTAGSYSNAAAAGTGISSQDPTKICIYTATDPSIAQAAGGGGTLPIWTLDTCLPRAPVPTPTVINCCQFGLTVSCSHDCMTSNFAPAMVVKLAVGSYSTQGVLAANAFAADSSYTTKLNLAGYEYGASVTDDTFITPDKFPTIPNTTTHNPAWSCGNTSNFAATFTASDYNTSNFPTTPAANNGTYFGTSGISTYTSTYLPARSGTHQNGSNPSEQNCVGATIPYYITTNTASPMVQTAAIYRSGLVYVNNKYLVGGNYICLNTLTQNTCATNTSNCVLASLQNTAFFDCSVFNTKVLGAYPDISYCGSIIDPTCQFLSTIGSPNNNSITVYQCGSTTTNPPVNPYKCYGYSSSTTTGALCTVSSDPVQRITPAPPSPAGSSPILTANQYYDPNINQGSVQSTITNAGTNTPPVVQDCGSYLNRVVDINDPTSNPYVGISQCAVIDSSTAGNATPLCTGSTSIVGTPPNPMPPGMCYNSNLQLPVCSTSAPIIESFTSTLTTSPSSVVKLDVHNCYSSHTNPITKVATGQNNYCYSATYTPASTPNACQINTSTVSRLTTGGNPAVGSPTLDCSSFIALFGNSNPVSLISNSPYANIAACPSSPPGSVTTTLTDTSAGSAFAVDIYQYATVATSTSTSPLLAPPMSQMNYCYKPKTTGGGSCTLSRTNTEASRPSAIDCRTLLTLINSNYQSIISCATPPVTCASQAIVDSYATQNYANTARCNNPTPPTCTIEATASSATTGKNVTVKKCSYDTDITLNYASGESNTTTTTQNYYCYSYNGDSAASPSCSLAPLDLAITPVSNPVPSSLSTTLPTLSIPTVITDINGAGATTPPSQQLPIQARGIRSKTMLEQGLCVPVPALPKCAYIELSNQSTGYAIWPAVAPGIQSQGSCKTGYIPISLTSLQRYCLISPEDAQPGVVPTPQFEPLTATMGCKPPVCDSVTTLSSSDGYALWQGPNSDGSTPLDQQATGICANGYTPSASGGLTMRTCQLNGAVASLSPVDAATSCTPIPWDVIFTYSTGVNVPPSSNATPTYYASNFVSSSQTIANYISNTNNEWHGGVTTSVSGNKTVIFVPGPSLPAEINTNDTWTLYLNIRDITKIAKIAFIDNFCSTHGAPNCLSTARDGQSEYPSFSANPLVVISADEAGIFEDILSLSVTPNGQSSGFSEPGWGAYKWFGWESEGYGGHDGWLIYTTAGIDDNVGIITQTLKSGLNTIQLRAKRPFHGGQYPNGLGFWYIELLP